MAHLDDLYRIAAHLGHGPGEAEDLVQETYARALASYRQFEPGTRLKAWLAKILHNLFYDRYRRAKRVISLDDREAGGCGEKLSAVAPGPLENLLRAERSEKIGAAVARLPDEFRMAVVLVDLGDLSYAEAAEILSCPVGTVRSRLSRARQLLRQQLSDYVLDDENEKKTWK